MALPPERISIKRRRQEEPVETLILEQGDAANPKRQFTDFFFQRLRDDKAVEPEERAQKVVSRTTGNSAKLDAFGIPIVKASAPGDEVRAYANYRSATKKQHEASSKLIPELESNKVQIGKSNDTGNGIQLHKVKSTRRFHLAREISSALKPNLSGGIRRRKLNLRPPIATFVERHADSPEEDSFGQENLPKDSIIEVGEGGTLGDPDNTMVAETISKSKTAVNTFSKAPPSSSNKTGNSVQDDPSTWDLESDQLADELAALALEIDTEIIPEGDKDQNKVQEKPDELPRTGIAEPEDDYIFETYIRVRHDGSLDVPLLNSDDDFGVLVIDDDDQELWEKYVRDDDDEDDDWDEEDEDSNAEDNPHNDYPEEEVSSDDEYGRNLYKYRRDAFDDEEQGYDDERTARKAYH